MHIYQILKGTKSIGLTVQIDFSTVIVHGDAFYYVNLELLLTIIAHREI